MTAMILLLGTVTRCIYIVIILALLLGTATIIRRIHYIQVLGPAPWMEILRRR